MREISAGCRIVSKESSADNLIDKLSLTASQKSGFPCYTVNWGETKVLMLMKFKM